MPVVKKNHAGTWGGIQQLRGQNFAIFDPLPLRRQFLYPERGQKQTIFDPLPPHLVHVVIEGPLEQSSGALLDKAALLATLPMALNRDRTR